MPKKKRSTTDQIVVAPISNYYGTVWVESYDSKFYFTIDDDSTQGGIGGRVEVSREFFDAFVKEFSQQRRDSRCQ